MDKIICIKLTTGEEVVAILKKSFTEGDLRVANVMSLVFTEAGQGYLEPYLLGGNCDQLDFRASTIVTSADARQPIIDLFLKTISMTKSDEVVESKRLAN